MKALLSGVILSGAALLVGCHNNEAPQAATIETVNARLVSAQQQQVPEGVAATGTVRAKDTAIISAQVMGRIEQVQVREGDTVRAGQTLIVIDGAALRQSVAQAQAGVIAAQNQEAAARSGAALASTTLARYKQLQAEQSVSPQEMDEVTRRAEAAQSQLDAAHARTEAARAQAVGAQTMLAYSRLTAPFSGIVTARMADPGTMATPGMPLLQVDRAGSLQLQVTVDESAIGSVRIGMRIPTTIDGAPQPMQGTVSEIVPAADPASHTFMIKIDLPASTQLRAGMYGSAQFSSGTRAAILVPRSAIVARGSLDCAYVVDAQGIAQLRYLTLGAAHGDLVEVLSGIAAGEQLVDAPADRDLAGKRIAAESGARP
ncbi:MAG TPA: efflux RND transporter periplasmic adaptor subunit [Terracidiphilus sp.]|nr:efflux RND transporter periplasmic adaptor subunit [Terracidiphilus sp.]